MEEINLWKEENPVRSKLLVEYGFIDKNAKSKYEQHPEKKIYEPIAGNKFNEDDADEENVELLVDPNFSKGKETYGKTGFPKPLHRYYVVWEVYDLSLEEPYFWILDSLKENFPEILKLEDSFAAAENSAFFGVTQQRLGAQQEKVSQYLATAGKMIKEMFQMVRELRILDERLGYYRDVNEEIKKMIAQRGKSAEITLKGVFIDLVQGGGKSASSVYGMARELEFVTLPDLFFDAPPFKDKDELEGHIAGLRKDFNQNVLRVLERHLRQYMEWRLRTGVEHENRRRFMLQYLLQHFRIIQMYVVWVKPYLRHVARLSMKGSRMRSADLVSAFEGSMLDVELLARRKTKEGVGANSCILASFTYRTRPELKIVQEGYQRGPVHIGRLHLTLRAYAWSDKQIENYTRLKEKETMMLMSDISGAVSGAMDALGEELDRYIAEARGEEYKKKEEGGKKSEKKEEKSFAEKFFGDFYTPKDIKDKKKSSKPSSKKDKEAKEKLDAALKSAGKGVTGDCFIMYKNFKKSRGMTSW
ncbi:MAG: hypothetical protein V2A62_04410 [Candidatus Woesearchaeota archaeon]